MTNKYMVVVGGGISGMFSAYLLAKKYPNKKICIIEKQETLGGTYNSINYENGYLFDIGIHILYSTGIEAIDNVFFDIIAKDNWHIMHGNRKDIAGLFFNGNLQTYSHYMDFRDLPDDSIRKYIADFYLNLTNDENVLLSNAQVFLENQFGSLITQEIHQPLLEKMWGIAADKLDCFAIKANALERIILHDTSTMESMMKSSILSSRIAYPDQLNLPPVRKEEQFALYPKQFGMHTFASNFQQTLESMGVEILTQCSINNVSLSQQKINKVSYTDKNGTSNEIDVDEVVWSLGWPALSQALKQNISDIPFDIGPSVIFVNIVFEQSVKMEEIYYFYCYDEGFGSYRVSNYENFCSEASKYEGYPVCVEFWPSKLGLKANELHNNEILDIVISELKKFGVFTSDNRILFSDVINNGYKFPMPSVKNMDGLIEIQKRLNIKSISNLTAVGIMAEQGLFFSHDILRHVYKVIVENK